MAMLQDPATVLIPAKTMGLIPVPIPAKTVGLILVPIPAKTVGLILVPIPAETVGLILVPIPAETVGRIPGLTRARPLVLIRGTATTLIRDVAASLDASNLF